MPDFPVPQQSALPLDPRLAQEPFCCPDPSFKKESAQYPPDQFGTQHLPLQTGNGFLSSTPSINNDGFDDDATLYSATTAPSSLWSENTPQLANLLPPGTDMNAPPPEYTGYQSMQPIDAYQPRGLHSYSSFGSNSEEEPINTYQPHTLPTEQSFGSNSEDDVEEIIRQPDHAESWLMPFSPAFSSSSSSSSDSCFDVDMFTALYSQPKLHFDSEEMLTMRFDRQTCGILSIKDGPNENPWRTILWPLAKDSSALRYAINAMTAFHASQERPVLRVKGWENMNCAMRLLAGGINNMRVEIALAITIALAWADSWDQHISTGIAHLRGARKLVMQAFMKYKQGSLSPPVLQRLQFLCNTWVYMDVIARLTSANADKSEDFDTVLSPMCGPSVSNPEIDPLMGCASTLFPYIGRVANLVSKVRNSADYSYDIISEAAELRSAIERWEPPLMFAAPQDVSLEIKDSLKTAEAYRWATILYLHQAVPEASSELDSAADFAKKVLENLAAVPVSSRAVIIHIYPLLAAGCEAVGEKDRSWVTNRWTSMIQRMQIGNLNACWKVVKEVWDRRDSFEEEKKRQKHRLAASQIQTGYMPIERVKRKFRVNDEDEECEYLGGGKRRAIDSAMNPTPTLRSERSSTLSIDPSANIDQGKTVRGRLHWVGVMKDWEWEGRSNVLYFHRY